MSGRKIAVAQLEVMDLNALTPRKGELLSAMTEMKQNGYHSVLLMLTDIMKEGSEMLIVSDDPSVVEKAFGVKAEGSTVWLPGVMSRKKQVVPNFEKAFK